MTVKMRIASTVLLALITTGCVVPERHEGTTTGGYYSDDCDDDRYKRHIHRPSDWPVYQSSSREKDCRR